MRLLNTETGQFVEKDPKDPKVKYAILSHTWDSKGEQTYPELKEIQNRHHSPHSAEHRQGGSSPTSSQPSLSTTRMAPASAPSPDTTPARSDTPLGPIWADSDLSPKIREACRVARANGYRYLWIDSCCIDKTSSSELSEAINSMYQWYACADVCYAFLADVPAEEDRRRKDSKFRLSRWFTRGWTLQELIAPANVVFLCGDWTFIGSKHSLASLLAEITNISYNALLRVEPLKEFSVAERLSWAARRQTTRVEDRAYSVLGIFAINMPTLYGEGEGAFRRLQEEIMRRIPDESLFAWTPFHLDSPPQLHELDIAAQQQSSRRFFCFGYYGNFDTPSLLAPSLDLFMAGGRIEAVSHDEVIRRLQPRSPHLPATDYSFTPHGIRTQVPVIPLSPYLPAGATEYHLGDILPSQWYLVVLGCEHKDLRGHLLCRICYIPPSESSIEFLHCGRMSVLPSLESAREFDLLSLSPAAIKCLRPPKIDLKTVYIFHLDPADGALEVARRQRHETINLVLLRKTRNALSALGYAAELRGPDQAHPTTHWLTLSDDTRTITIEYQHTLKDNGRQLTIEAHIWMAGYPPASSDSGPRDQASESSFRTRRVSWDDSCPWDHAASAGTKTKQVMLSTTPAGRPKPAPLTLNLGLAFAAKDHYAIHVEVLKDATLAATSSGSGPSSLSQQLTRVGKRGGSSPGRERRLAE
ncbi:HET-domain-containing protein [Ganoderma leucocontextum]|nr:HET-domain-containing protein [Ganoderma leucocontextum]